jgi:hypothetical protein
MSSRKRSRSVGEENRADCPFTISYATGPSRAEQERHKNKKQKCEDQDDDKRVQLQISPFSPTGSFKTHDTMDLHYIVEPRKQWQSMTRYNSFVRKYPMKSRLRAYREGLMADSWQSTTSSTTAKGSFRLPTSLPLSNKRLKVMAKVVLRRTMMTGSRASSRFVLPMSITFTPASTGCTGPMSCLPEPSTARRLFKVASRTTALRN